MNARRRQSYPTASLRKQALTPLWLLALAAGGMMASPLARGDSPQAKPSRQLSLIEWLRQGSSDAPKELPATADGDESPAVDAADMDATEIDAAGMAPTTQPRHSQRDLPRLVAPVLRRGPAAAPRPSHPCTERAMRAHGWHALNTDVRGVESSTRPRPSHPYSGRATHADADLSDDLQWATQASAIRPGALPPSRGLLSREPLGRHRRPDYDEKPIGSLTTNILVSRGELPANYAAARFEKEGMEFHTVGTSRPWLELVYNWEATGFFHGPLYFEQPNAERLGHSTGVIVQPFILGAHFFAHIPALPYMVVAEPPLTRCYTLGHYRPGRYAPWRYIRLPVSIAGGVAQTGVVLGLVYLIP
jgi:hypothetical protein